MIRIYYDLNETVVMTQVMEHIGLQLSLAQQHIIHKGLKKLRIEGKKAIGKEIGQLHNRICFKPVHIKLMNTNKRRKAQLVLAYLCKKSSREIKG